MMFEDLPAEVVDYIVRLVPTRNRYHLRHVNRLFYGTVSRLGSMPFTRIIIKKDEYTSVMENEVEGTVEIQHGEDNVFASIIENGFAKRIDIKQTTCADLGDVLPLLNRFVCITHLTIVIKAQMITVSDHDKLQSLVSLRNVSELTLRMALLRRFEPSAAFLLAGCGRDYFRLATENSPSMISGENVTDALLLDLLEKPTRFFRLHIPCFCLTVFGLAQAIMRLNERGRPNTGFEMNLSNISVDTASFAEHFDYQDFDIVCRENDRAQFRVRSVEVELRAIVHSLYPTLTRLKCWFSLP